MSCRSSVQIEKPIYGGAFLARVEGKAVLCRSRCRANRRACALWKTSAATRPPKLRRLSPPRRSALRPRARTLAPAAAATISTRTTRRNLRFKQAILRETLERGGVRAPEEIACLPAEPWAYRNRIRLAFDAAGNPGYRGRRSHAVDSDRRVPDRRAAAGARCAGCAEIAATIRAARCGPLRSRFSAMRTKPRCWSVSSPPAPHKIASTNLPARCRAAFLRSRASNLSSEGARHAAAQSGAMGRHVAHLSRRRLRLSRGSRRIFPGESLAGGRAGRTGDGGAERRAGMGPVRRRRPVCAQACGEFRPRGCGRIRAGSDRGARRTISQELRARSRRLDTLDFLRSATRDGERPDLIVVDPPRTGWARR